MLSATPVVCEETVGEAMSWFGSSAVTAPLTCRCHDHRELSATSPPTARSLELEEKHRQYDTRLRHSWTRKINHPSEVLKKNDEIEAIVLAIDKGTVAKIASFG